jgi:hypothetical protein
MDVRGSGNIDTGSDNIDTGSGDEVQSDPFTSDSNILRSNSVTVSEWGLEHTLKLRDDPITTKPNPLVVIDEDTTAPAINGDELPLPLTPKTNELSLIKPLTDSNYGGSDWWSQALAQNDIFNTQDYDSLIDKIDKEQTTNDAAVSDTITIKAPALLAIEN